MDVEASLLGIRGFHNSSTHMLLSFLVIFLTCWAFYPDLAEDYDNGTEGDW